MEAKLKFAGFYPEAVTAGGDPRRSVALTIRGVIQKWDVQGMQEEVPLVVEMRGPIKGFPLGSFKQHEGPAPELTQNVWYYKVTADGEELLEIDVMSNIHRVAGNDILANYRDIIGA
jgi:P2 family phage contractile tail tube protein